MTSRLRSDANLDNMFYRTAFFNGRDYLCLENMARESQGRIGCFVSRSSEITGGFRSSIVKVLVTPNSTVSVQSRSAASLAAALLSWNANVRAEVFIAPISMSGGHANTMVLVMQYDNSIQAFVFEPHGADTMSKGHTPTTTRYMPSSYRTAVESYLDLVQAEARAIRAASNDASLPKLGTISIQMPSDYGVPRVFGQSDSEDHWCRMWCFWFAVCISNGVSPRGFVDKLVLAGSTVPQLARAKLIDLNEYVMMRTSTSRLSGRA